MSRTAFLSWLLREVCSFRDAEFYGEYTQKEAQSLRANRAPSSTPHRRPPPLLLPLIHLVINLFFFGIPHTYYAHVKASFFLSFSASPPNLALEALQRVPWTLVKFTGQLGLVHWAVGERIHQLSVDCKLSISATHEATDIMQGDCSSIVRVPSGSF